MKSQGHVASALKPLAAACVLLFLSIASDGLEVTVLQQRVVVKREPSLSAQKQPDGSEPASETRQSVYLAGRLVRLEEEDDNVTIIRFDRGVLYTLDVLLRSYEERDIKNLRARWKKVNALLLEQIEGAPKEHPRRFELIDELTDSPEKWDLVWGLPDGPRKNALLKKYNLPAKKPQVKIIAEKEQKNIAGYNCRLYKVLEDAKLRSFAWLAPDIRIENELLDFLKVAGVLPDEVASELEKVKGFPLEYAVHWRDGRIEHIVTEKVLTTTLSAAEKFEVPAGFQRTEPHR